jgi:hypothetical protein
VAVAAAAAHQAAVRTEARDTAAGRIAALDADVARTDVALAEIAAAQRAYVAPGQGLDFWAGRVDEALASARASMSAMRSAAGSDAAPAAESAISRLHDFAVMDRSVRDYVRDGRYAMASDLIFADGYEIMAAARAELAAAAGIERAALDGPRSRDRQLQLASAAVLAACTLLAALLLLRGPKSAEPVVTALAAEPVVTAEPLEPARASGVPASDDPIGAALDASLEGLDALPPSPPSPSLLPLSSASPSPAGASLPDAADVCVDLARLLDARDLQPVVARIASVLGAEGLIVWMADAEGRSLGPALTHGYAPSLVGRIGGLPIDADNATAAAFRSKATQVVDGALAVPLLSSSGCTGVLALEMKDGQERAGDVQSLARIMAAQLAATVAGPAVEQRKAAEA